jgi:hypothetical protein
MRKRNKKGVSLIESVIGLVVIIPIGLAALDMYAFMVAAQQNEELTESAARVAATKGSQSSAEAAISEIIDRVQTSAIVKGVVADQVKYDPVASKVTITFSMTVHLPVPFPNYENLNCQATSIEPIVAMPAPL